MSGDFSELVNELFDIAVTNGSMQRPGGGTVPNPFVLRHGPYEIKVDYNGGSSKHIELSAKYDAVARIDHPALVARARAYRAGAPQPLLAPRPLGIELTREDTDDVAAKASGLNVEWQSGDPAFDGFVYVDTPTTDPEILASVLGPEVRRAVCELIAMEFKTIMIDDGGDVSAYLSEFSSSEPPRPNRGADALRWFVQILSNLPAVASSGPMVKRNPLFGLTVTLGVVGFIGWGLNYFYVEGILWLAKEALGISASAATFAWTELVIAVAIAIAAGIVGAFIHGRIVGALSRGTSSALRNVRMAQLGAWAGVSVLAFTAVAFAILFSHGK